MESMDLALDDIITKNNKRGGRRGGGAFRRGNPQRQARREQTPYKRKQFTKGNIEGEWKHDLFQENDVEEEVATDRSANRRPSVRKNFGGGRNESGAKVELENLEFSIDDQSLKEIIEEVADVKRVTVRYDANGKSLGTAELIFYRLSDAEAVLSELDGAEVEGRKIRLSIVGEVPVNRAPSSFRIRDRGTSSFRGARKFSVRGRGGKRFGGNRGGGDKPGKFLDRLA